MSPHLGRPTVIHDSAPKSGQPITTERYVSPAWLEAEFDRVWPRVWLLAGLERDVLEPGDYLVFEIGRESILVTRTKEERLAAFFNVCQHRGARVMVNDRGWVKRFVCPYHGWQYGYDGRLEHLPDPERFDPPIDCGARSLRPVRVDAVGGLVWICMDEAQVPLRDYLGEAWERIEPYRLDEMTLYADQSCRLECNWKAVFDNFLELYHVEHIHPQHQLLFDIPGAEDHLFARGHTGVVIDGHTVNSRLPIPDEPNGYLMSQLRLFGGDPDAYLGRVQAIREDIQKLRREAGPRLGWDYEHMTDERLSDIEQYNFFPNTMITVQPDEALITRAIPHPTDPNRCRWTKFTLRRQPDPAVAERAGVPFEPRDARDLEEVPRPEHDEFDQEDIIAGRKSFDITLDQDVHYIRDVQAGMHSRGFDTASLCSDEDRVQHYHDWLGWWMEQAADGPGPRP